MHGFNLGDMLVVRKAVKTNQQFGKRDTITNFQWNVGCMATMRVTCLYQLSIEYTLLKKIKGANMLR